ncbi:hypothetical protein ROA7450_02252 [Roseovarius albus]|uniref:Uncharacterized protein n=1 Tax=Roseovarius albus TaxID=1247867 RepID=A0A1X6ZAU0_9RHOB|nr:hypothetical protein ROA7450_02252 [Roseovarius albus]
MARAEGAGGLREQRLFSAIYIEFYEVPELELY